MLQARGRGRRRIFLGCLWVFRNKLTQRSLFPAFCFEWNQSQRREALSLPFQSSMLAAIFNPHFFFSSPVGLDRFCLLQLVIDQSTMQKRGLSTPCELRYNTLHTPGYQSESVCLVRTGDRVCVLLLLLLLLIFAFGLETSIISHITPNPRQGSNSRR